MPRPPPPAAALTISGGSPTSGIVGTPAARRDALGLELVAAGPQRGGRRADPGEAGRGDGLGEVGALGEEAVAGVNRVGAAFGGGAQVLVRSEIGGDLDRLVGRARVQRAGIVGRRDGDGLEAESLRGSEHPEGDLAAVGDEHLLHERTTLTAGGGAPRGRRSVTRHAIERAV